MNPESTDSAEIDSIVADLDDWRGATLAALRALILDAAPGIVEQIKWRKPSNGMRGVPTWSRSGLICTGETYQDKVKLTFAHGAALPDPAGLFNSSLGGATRRAIDVPEGREIDEAAFADLIRAAITHNEA